MQKLVAGFSILVASLSVSALAAPLAADNLIMKDGSEHQGRFVSGTATSVSFRERGRLVRYSTADIDAIQFSDPNQSSGAYNNGNYGSNGAPGVPSGGYDQRDQRDRADTRNDNSGTNDGRAYDSRGTYTGSQSNTSGANRDDNRDNGRGDTTDNRTQRDGRDAHFIPTGTELAIRTNEEIDSERARQGQTFSAQVDQDILGESNQVLIPRGSDALLTIKRVTTGGDTGTPEIALDVQSVTIAGRIYTIDTTDVEQKGTEGVGKNKRTGEMVGGGAIFGTIIGAIAGGGKGAAIGALAGAAAGGGVEVLTKGKTVRVPAETVLRFRLDNAVQLRGR